MPASRGWVLFQAAASPGRLGRSATAHTLLVGSGFALLLMLTAGQILRSELEGPALDWVSYGMAAGALLIMLPLPVATLLARRRRIAVLEVDPTGLMLHTRRGTVRVELPDLAEARVVARPAFATGKRGAGRRGELAELPEFLATLRLRTRDGARWDFVTGQSQDIEGALAWLAVLGAEKAIHSPPSPLAGTHQARDLIVRAQHLVGAAVAASAAAIVFQAMARAVPATMPILPWLTLGCIAVGCALYVAGWQAQVTAARAWLEARGLGSGPPPTMTEELLAPLPR